VVVVFAYLYLPETRDRTLEEIHEMFENKVPARKFRTYVCTGVESYAAAVRKQKQPAGREQEPRNGKQGSSRVNSDEKLD